MPSILCSEMSCYGALLYSNRDRAAISESVSIGARGRLSEVDDI